MQNKKYIIEIGCRRGTSCSEIEKAVKSVLKNGNIPFSEVDQIVSINLKQNETGLLEFAEKSQLPIRFFPQKNLLPFQCRTHRIL